MLIKNVYEEDVKQLELLVKEMRQKNPNITYEIFRDVNTKNDIDVKAKLDILEEKLNNLNQKLNHIFGEYILLQGRFVKI